MLFIDSSPKSIFVYKCQYNRLHICTYFVGFYSWGGRGGGGGGGGGRGRGREHVKYNYVYGKDINTYTAVL